MEPSYIGADEVQDEVEPRKPTKMEQYLAEVAEVNRLERKEADRRRAKRKRARSARKLNRKK